MPGAPRTRTLAALERPRQDEDLDLRPLHGYAIAISTGAFLLFLVQPLIGKYVLPWFGGGPEVWSACLLFFQTLLLAGYTYAHLSARYIPPAWQALVHFVLLLAATLTLPMIPAAHWQPPDSSLPILRILLLLTATIGLPYFVLAATSPLMQSWYTRTYIQAVPYRLYALSNAASLAALACYPFLLEPLLPRVQQAHAWSLGWGVFALASAYCAFMMWRSTVRGSIPAAPHRKVSASQASEAQPVLTAAVRLLWLGLPAGATTVLLATTNVICLDLAATPFLWLLPLGLYLLSFILCFDHERWYVRRYYLGVFIVGVLAALWLVANPGVLPIGAQIVIHLGTLFACCMVCHGELYRLRPAASGLTGYYLIIAAGGALGGLCVAVLAPLLLSSYVDLHLGLLACGLFVLLADRSPVLRERRIWYGALIVAAGLGVALVEQGVLGTRHRDVLAQVRNFYGVLAVKERDAGNPVLHRRLLTHGTTIHGVQFLAPERRAEATAYYRPDSGVGRAWTHLAERPALRVGVVGLGVGTLATYGRADDLLRFYEINPEVTRLAHAYFTYLADTAAAVEIVHGDARLSLQREPAQHYDLLALDAFSSDAVPLHLLTREAFELYLRHLADDGILAVHISTQYLDLESVVLRLADHFGLSAALIISPGDELRALQSSSWVLMARRAELLEAPLIRTAVVRPPRDFHRVSLWTDDHVNLWQVLGR